MGKRPLQFDQNFFVLNFGEIELSRIKGGIHSTKILRFSSLFGSLRIKLEKFF